MCLYTYVCVCVMLSNDKAPSVFLRGFAHQIIVSDFDTQFAMYYFFGWLLLAVCIAAAAITEEMVAVI